MSYILYYYDEDKLKITEKKEVFDQLYYLKARVPTKKQIKDYLKQRNIDNQIKKFFEGKNLDEAINEIKKQISKIDYKIPLYDEYTRNIYIINREDVYNRVIYQHYRFPDKQLLKLLKKRKKLLKPEIEKMEKDEKEEENLGDFEETTRIHYQIIHKTVKLQREYRKLTLMIDFMKQFDINILLLTYIKVFYYYAKEVGKNITICIKPSFLPYFPHLKPYYTRSELINMALNMEIIKPSHIYYDQKKIMELCNIIKKNDISADIILKHQRYIIENNKIGVVQYYSLQGSFFMNQYLRGFTNYIYKNEVLENMIESLWRLINGAPEFDQSYILYRFIKEDTHLRHLNINDVYTEPSFISTTRDPFYRSKTYKFGFILIKIKIPANIKGVALCIETFSHFPEEQEIILSPLSKLKLIRKDTDVPYYHTDDIYAAKIKTRYEFVYIGKEEIQFPKRSIYDSENKLVNFLKLEKKEVLTINERIRNFIKSYVNPMFQFKTKIGENIYTLIVEWYDSTSVYKNFYAARTDNGFIIYTIIDNFIGFTVELGEDNESSYMYVNYYFRFSTIPKEGRIKDKDLIDFLSKLAYYFEIKNIIIYAEYQSCDFKYENQYKNDMLYYGGNYCTDFYNYLKKNEKKYKDIDSIEIKSNFNYYELERLRDTNPLVILSKDDRDELYQMYIKIYQPLMDQSKHNLADFYIWLVENHCFFVKFLTDKMHRLYNINNPFINDYYILDSITYLYNKNLIDEYITVSPGKTVGPSYHVKDFQKNDYRLELTKKNRLPKSEET